MTLFVVVLVTVLVIAVYLFGVDWLWSWLLKLIGVLRFDDSGGGLGSNASTLRVSLLNR